MSCGAGRQRTRALAEARRFEDDARHVEQFSVAPLEHFGNVS